DGSIDVLADPDNFVEVKDKLLAAGFTPESAEVTMRAATDVSVDRASAENMLKLLDMLDDLDDTQNVYSNADIPDDVLAELA
ncbi:MAG: YebC/PmpR family DNA-binding transcriptional regulator, partial [Gammaproteobacteria bacterium]